MEKYSRYNTHFSIEFGKIIIFNFYVKLVIEEFNGDVEFTLFFQEFIRVGYYVSNEYSDPELQETPPETPNFDKLTRNILASNPRVTKFKINWEDPSKV